MKYIRYDTNVRPYLLSDSLNLATIESRVK